MSFLSLVGVEFKKIKRSKIFLILFAATVILWIPSVSYTHLELRIFIFTDVAVCTVIAVDFIGL